jgi:radical SAM superfamily enzyme
MEKTEICQSCGMPLSGEVYGTEKDGSVNKDYCIYCYKDGAFTSNSTMEEMIEICVPHMVNEGMGEEQSRKILNEMLPTLKRWKK